MTCDGVDDKRITLEGGPKYWMLPDVPLAEAQRLAAAAPPSSGKIRKTEWSSPLLFSFEVMVVVLDSAVRVQFSFQSPCIMLGDHCVKKALQEKERREDMTSWYAD